MLIKKIFVPVDFSEYSDHAVDHALFIAEKNNSHVTLFHTIVLFQKSFNEVAPLRQYENFVKKKEEETFRYLQLHNEKALEKGITIDSQVTPGFSAADAILDYINDNDFDVVIMCTHGRTGFKKWFYGSVAEKVVCLSPIPVLTTMKPLRKFAIGKTLIPMDFSDYSKQAAERAIALGQEFGSQLVFMHVTSIFKIDSELPKRSEEKLREFTDVSDENATYVIKQGRAHHEIVKYANDNGVDLIIMATRGLSGLDHILFGSTTERVVRLANCPVLTLEREDS